MFVHTRMPKLPRPHDRTRVDHAKERSVASPNAGAQFDFGSVSIHRPPAVMLCATEVLPEPDGIDHSCVTEALEHSGAGEPLAEPIRGQMEAHFGVDFGAVRVHYNEATAARTLHARAFTIADEIFFAGGPVGAGDATGRRLMVHELAHVVQGYQGRVPERGREVAHPRDPLEREAAKAEEIPATDPCAVPMCAAPSIARSTAPAQILRKGEDTESPAPGKMPYWVEFVKGEWNGRAVLANLIGAGVDVPKELADAIVAGAVPTAYFLVGLRDRVDRVAAEDPKRVDECSRAHNTLTSRITELVYATSLSPLRYQDLKKVAALSVTFRSTPAPSQVDVPAQPTMPAAEDRGQFSESYYRGKGNRRRLQADIGNKNMTYERFKQGQGKLLSTSESTSEADRKAHPELVQVVLEPLNGDDLLDIFDRTTPPKDPTQVQQWQEVNEKTVAQLPRINAAFRIMKMDTAGAQAHYLANAYQESSQFQYMTETQKAAKDTPFRETGDAKLDTGWLNDAKDGVVAKGTPNELKVTGYNPGGSVNKAGTATQDDWEHGFIGRGPLQVTHDWGYLQALAVLENRLDDLERLPADSPERADIPLLAKALREIKQNPSMAAHRDYAYLFSASIMKRRKPTRTGGWSAPTDSGIARSAEPAIYAMGDHSQPSLAHTRQKKNEIFGRAIKRITEKNAAILARQKQP